MLSAMRPRNIRSEQVNVLDVGNETLVYDERTHKAWCLNHSSACIWRLCDGENSVALIEAKAAAQLGAEVDNDLVLVTIDELHQKGLLQPDSIQEIPRDVSRRQMISRSGLAAAALLPIIAALTAPPAAAQSGSVGTGKSQLKRLERMLEESRVRRRRSPW